MAFCFVAWVIQQGTLAIALELKVWEEKGEPWNVVQPGPWFLDSVKPVFQIPCFSSLFNPVYILIIYKDLFYYNVFIHELTYLDPIHLLTLSCLLLLLQIPFLFSVSSLLYVFYLFIYFW